MSSAGFTTPGKNKTPQLMNAIHLSHGQGTPVYKRPMSYTPVKPLPTRKELLSRELGLNYESDGPHSNSSEDGPGDMTQVDSPSVRIVKYNALKKQMKTMSEERESLLLKISKLREQLKQQKKQIETEESDRKNQLHIMKNTYEQASSDKNRVIGLFESVVREQECELEELRKISDTRGLGTCVDFPNSQGGTAISRLTAQLNQVIQEKNDILAQFCSQQSLIKEQQAEVKGLLRCKAENADLQGQVSNLNRTVANLTKQSEGHKQKLSVSDDEVARLRSEVEGLRQAAETTLSKQAVTKLEEQNTKLQDKLLRKEAEFVELDLKHQENEKLIGQLRLDLSQRKEQVVEKFIEIPVESEAAKLELAYYKSEAKELTQTINRVKNEHRTELAACETKYQETIAGMQSEISDARGQYTKFSAMLKSRDEKEEEANNRHKTVVDGLEKQLRQKKSELTKLRQDMVDKVVELEQRRDADLENLQLSLTQNMADAAKENKRLKERLGEVQPQLDELRADYLHMRELCVQLQQLNKSETISVAKQLNNAISQVNEHNKDLVRKYRKEVALRKKYHNELVELKGNIRVFCRVRPVIKEDGISPHTVLTADVDDEDVLVVENSKGRTQQFDVDKLFLPEMSQEKVFDEVKALVTSCVDGYHVCIFAYGQTGSGKTYTMEGPSSDPGINQRALALLFEQAADRSTDWSFDIKVSVLEIYNETVRDLLSSDPSDKLDIKLNQDGNLHVPGLSWVQVKNVNEVNQTFELGHQNRATASTNMNEYSSRSHALLCVEVTGLNRTTGAKTLGKLHLVDLAGSERVSKSGADGARLKEAQSINKSLSALGDVIAALRSRQNFVPYRNSKLTYLLQESLGGDSKVLMIVQVAPVERHVNETLCSLNFAQRVRSVELGAAGRKFESAEVTALKGRLAHYENSSPLSTPTKQTTPYGTPSRRK